VAKAGLCTRVFGMLPTNFSRERSLSMMSVGWRVATVRGRGTILGNYEAKFELVVIKRKVVEELLIRE
jgi:hypothetical protein